MLRCVIIDDEPLARECIAGYVADTDFLQLNGTGSNPVELKQLLDSGETELVFLDIQMPVMNGIDFLKMVQRPPMVIITTAYPEFALEGFQLDVLDYLLKPITFDRFFKAVCKAKDYHGLVQRSNATNKRITGDGEYFFVRCDHKYEKIYFEDILYIQGLENYVCICTRKGKYLTLLSLKNVQDNLDSESFIRVHKSYIVPVSGIKAIEGNDILVETFRIPISRVYRDELIERVVNKRLWKK
jgi:DNA-binding LytR/AlgR family response regulator